MAWTSGEDRKIIEKLDEYIFKSNKELAELLLRSGEFKKRSHSSLKRRVIELRKSLGK